MSQRSANNVYFNVPELMEDGRIITQYAHNMDLNEKFIENGNIITNADYRKYLQQNAGSIIEQNRNKTFYESSNVNNNIPEYETKPMSDLKTLYLSREELQSQLYNKPVNINNNMKKHLK